MKVHVHHRQPAQVAAWLRDAGFTVDAQMLSGVEVQAEEGAWKAQVAFTLRIQPVPQPL
ncbi:hypothetical protein [Nonomuraea sp. NPDC049129]|uniref:hypothetical protein n=1 Tax=Nonomuraea sp. NPDC049129 TaxID=3155272 RepID=UPI0033CD76E4